MEKLQPIKPDRCHKGAKFGCAASCNNHFVPYYDSGGFTFRCPWCMAKLLQSEYLAYTRTKNPILSLCCSSGKAHTPQMQEHFASIQDPIDSIKVSYLGLGLGSQANDPFSNSPRTTTPRIQRRGRTAATT